MTTRLVPMTTYPWRSRVSRRTVLRALGTGATGVLLTGCGGSTRGPANVADVAPADFSARFAGFTPETEPNGDLANVVWPDYVVDAGPEIKRLYEFQVTHGELMRYMPCFCGCNLEAGHRSNRDCYIKEVSPAGVVVFDAMAPT